MVLRQFNVPYCVKLLGWYIQALNFFSLLILVFLNWEIKWKQTGFCITWGHKRKEMQEKSLPRLADWAKVSFITTAVLKPCKLKPLAPNSLFVWCRWGHQYFILWWQVIMKTKTEISMTRNLWILTKLPTFTRWFECYMFD